MNSVGYRYRPRAGLIPRSLEFSAAGLLLGGGGILHCAIPPWEHDASLDESEAYQPSMGPLVLLPEKFAGKLRRAASGSSGEHRLMLECSIGRGSGDSEARLGVISG